LGAREHLLGVRRHNGCGKCPYGLCGGRPQAPTRIEAHGEAQDVAAEVLAQAFFTVLEARKACNQGHVETAMKLYDSIPLGPVISEIAD